MYILIRSKMYILRLTFIDSQFSRNELPFCTSCHTGAARKSRLRKKNAPSNHLPPFFEQILSYIIYPDRKRLRNRSFLNFSKKLFDKIQEKSTKKYRADQTSTRYLQINILFLLFSQKIFCYCFNLFYSLFYFDCNSLCIGSCFDCNLCSSLLDSFNLTLRCNSCYLLVGRFISQLLGCGKRFHLCLQGMCLTGFQGQFLSTVKDRIINYFPKGYNVLQYFLKGLFHFGS